MYKRVSKLIVGFIISLGLAVSGSITANAEEELSLDSLPKMIDISLVSREGELTTFDWLLSSQNRSTEIVSYRIYCEGRNSNGKDIVANGFSDGNMKQASCQIPSDWWGSIQVWAFDKNGKQISSSNSLFFYIPQGNPSPPVGLGKVPYVTSVRPVSSSIADENEVIIKWQQPVQEIVVNPIIGYTIAFRKVGQTEYLTKTVPANILESILELPSKGDYIFGVKALYAKGAPEGSHAYTYTSPSEEYYAPCPDVQLIAARGSDEPLQDDDGTVIKGSEEQTLLTNEQISEALPGYVGIINGGVETVYAQNLAQEIKKKINPETGVPYTVDTYAVPYPAVKPVFGDAFNWSVDQFWVNNIAFGQSVNTGSEMTSSKIEKVRNLCPDTKIVLSGYSQGALAVAQATDALGKQDIHVDSIVLFGDPFFNPKDDMADRSNYSFEHSGMLATREFWEQTTKAPVSSYCHDLDVFCNITSAYTKQLDPLVPTTAAAQNNGNMYAPHESYPEIWAPANDVQATLEAAQQTVKDLKL